MGKSRMLDFSNTGKFLILVGAALVVIGLIVTFVPNVPFLGKLPGDIRIKSDHFEFFFPLTTCILLSLLLSRFFWLFRR